MKHKVVYKYGTGHLIPLNAKYLCTQVETETIERPWIDSNGTGAQGTVSQKSNILVWHYYELEIEESK